ncbi:MAG TPA: glycoside hydrolase family 43 protein, partial [Solirubrobacteraceae bacterium]|nr:glycoside hydrolase family 43 protein [Solirubrobacteraceae bacterium]
MIAAALLTAAALAGAHEPGPVIVAGPSKLTTARVATFEFVHDDPAARLRCRVDHGPRRRCGSPFRTGALADGRHRFEVVARGRADVVVWRVDATPPPFPTIIRTDPARFTFTGRRTSCSLDDAPAEPCASPLEYGELQPGAHRFSVTARDRAGNASSAADEWTASVAPEVGTGAAGALRPTSAEVTGTAPHAAYHFEYGTTVDYGSRTLARAAPADGVVTATLTGLRPETTYHYRLVASTCGGCEAGTARGVDATLTTPAITMYQNPVYGGLPDPMALKVGSDYYAYGTGERFPMARSSDFVHWTPLPPAMATRPAWVPGGTAQWNPWAPSVLRRPGACPGTSSPECFVMYYTGLNTTLEPDVNCIGVAVSPSPAGPFRDTGILDTDPSSRDSSGRPIGCGDDAGHSNIDPAPFIDPATGQGYLYLSTGHEPSTAWRRTISVIPLTDDRLHAAAPRIPLFSFTQDWEDDVVEGPWVTRHDEGYYLFYSGGTFTNFTYGLGFARATSPTGPFTKPTPTPLLQTGALVDGPGGGSLVDGPHGGDWLVYHGRAWPGAARTMRIDPLEWDDSASPATVTVRGPTVDPRE